MDERAIARVKEAASEYSRTASKYGVKEKEDRREDKKQRSKDKALNKVRPKQADERDAGLTRREGVAEGFDPPVTGAATDALTLGAGATGRGPVPSNKPVSAPVPDPDPALALTDSERAALFLAAEMRRISDPFLVFDDDGMEIPDPSEEYSADTLGEREERRGATLTTLLLLSYSMTVRSVSYLISYQLARRARGEKG